MSDRRADDDTQPLAPRRPLTTTGASAATSSTTGSSGGIHARTTQDFPARPSAPAPPPSPSSSSATDTSRSRVSDQPEPSGSSAPVPAAVTEPRTPAARPKGRKARLRLSRIDPWSVMKMAFALSIALAVVTVVAILIVWSVLSSAGVWDAINDGISAFREGESTGFDVTEVISLERVLGVALVLSALNVVLITTLATLAAFLYNLAASLLGGFEVTLAEDR